MAELTPELAPQVVAACTENGEEAAGALGRAFDGEFVLKPGESGTRETVAGDALSGPGLVFAFQFGDEHLIAALPASTGLVPEWAKSPDPTGESKLSTLAQELSMLLVPDKLMSDAFEAKWVDDIPAAIELAQPAEEAAALAVELAKGETLGQLTLLWPVADAMAAYGSADETSEVESASTETPPPQSHVLRAEQVGPRDYRDLPPNSLSALRVSVPVSVNLAGKRVPLSEVVEIGPGSIITFDTSCDDPIEVAAGGRRIAKGEAVKVGERFGVKILEMILPDEHFRPMLPSKAR